MSCKKDPCDHCKNYSCYADEYWIDEECKLYLDPPSGMQPCPSFIPRLASDSLLEEIANEEEEKEWIQMMEENE